MGAVTQTTAEVQSNLDWHIPKTEGAGIKVDPATPTFPWQDIIGLVQLNPVVTTRPAIQAFTTNVNAYSYDSGDRLDCVYHIPHDYVPGTDLFLHLHYGHNGTAVDATTFDIDADTAYASRDTGVFTETAVTPTFSIDMDTAVQFQHYVSEIQLSAASPSTSQIDSDDIEVDGIILVSFTVTAIPGITAGDDPFIFTADIHYQSTGIGTKQNASPFYT